MASTLTVDQIHDLSVRMSSGIDPVDLDALTTELGKLATLKHAIEAREARLALEVDRLMRDAAAARGVPAERQGKGVAETVAAARRISPTQGRAAVALAKRLRELPQIARCFAAGQLSEFKASLIARETTVLDPNDLAEFDRRMATTPRLDELGTRKIAHRAQTIALALDEEAVVRRRDKAVENRHVTIRPTDRGDGMAWLTALLPVEQAAAVREALDAAADTAVALGAASTRAQVMADALVERIVGGHGAGLDFPAHPVTLNLIMTDTALLDGDTTQPAHLAGHGPIPTALAKRLIQSAQLDLQKVELRRLYTHPATGELVTMESAARLFPKALRQFIRLRDQLCRTPGCGARIAHTDHIDDWADGGATTAANGQGLCRQCNWAKQVLGNQASHPPPLASPRGATHVHHGRPRIRLDVYYERAA